MQEDKEKEKKEEEEEEKEEKRGEAEEEKQGEAEEQKEGEEGEKLQREEDEPKGDNAQDELPPLQQRNQQQFYISSSGDDDDDDDENPSSLVLNNEKTQSQYDEKNKERVLFEEVQQNEQASFMERIKEVEQEAQQKKEEARIEQERRAQRRLQKKQRQDEQKEDEDAAGIDKLKSIHPQVGHKIAQLNQGDDPKRRSSADVQQIADQQPREARSNTLQDNSVLAIAGGAVSQANEVPRKEEAQKILTEAASERKSEVFAKVRNWEDHRDNVISQHRAIVENIFSHFERRIAVSDNAVNGVIKYFKERIDHEEKQKNYHLAQKSLGKLFKEQGVFEVYKKFRVKKDIGMVGRTWQDEEMVMTVDYNLLMFDNPQPHLEKVPELKMKVSKIKMKQKKDEKKDKHLVEMQYEVPGVLLSSKKKMTLKFESKDQLEEMKYFLETIGNHNFVTDL